MMRASRSRTRERTNLLTSTPDEAALAIACFLTTARDLLCLRLTCRRFDIKCISSGEGGPAPEMLLCLAEEAGRRWVAGCSEQERRWVPRRGLESWLGLMHEVGVLRLPLAFGRAHVTSITLSENGAVATKGVGDYNYRTAASTVVMQSGRHFAQFTVVRGIVMFFGVIRPGWDVENGVGASNADGHCFYATGNGRRFPGYNDWEGMQAARQGDRIGMLLDLDQGSMTVWKNDVQLGVMQAEGLSGPLCWAVSMRFEGRSARIESAPAPASPTEGELVSAKAWQEAHP